MKTFAETKQVYAFVNHSRPTHSTTKPTIERGYMTLLLQRGSGHTASLVVAYDKFLVRKNYP